jgi:hypothetical protein
MKIFQVPILMMTALANDTGVEIKKNIHRHLKVSQKVNLKKKLSQMAKRRKMFPHSLKVPMIW